MNRKIKSLTELAPMIRQHQERQEKVVTINGCFDMLQLGHIYILYEAKKQGEFLAVGLNSDASVKRLKGDDRPINNQATRSEIMAALEMVDYVFVFEEDDPRKFLSLLKPDVHVNDASYGLDCIEAEVLKTYGGRLYLVEKFNVPSTTHTIEKIKQTDNKGKK